jgi:hypothetical protein
MANTRCGWCDSRPGRPGASQPRRAQRCRTPRAAVDPQRVGLRCHHRQSWREPPATDRRLAPAQRTHAAGRLSNGARKCAGGIPQWHKPRQSMLDASAECSRLTGTRTPRQYGALLCVSFHCEAMPDLRRNAPEVSHVNSANVPRKSWRGLQRHPWYSLRRGVRCGDGGVGWQAAYGPHG